MQVQLREIAFSRTGDKGDTCSVGIVPYSEDHIDILRDQVTVDRVRTLFGPLVKGEIRRYEFRGIKALNFVLEKALGGGVSRSLNMDLHGKSYASLMMSLMIDMEVENPSSEEPRQ
jgi:hypothetical protein